uniref:Uncharacterized protein n=1 Tax=Anopheles atroparvus TaxID=41427 RepID=A0A182J7X3_ANOAO
MVNLKTLATFDTEQSADSVEWCPHDGWKHIFVCGTYQLERDETMSAAFRKGRILLLKYEAEAPVPLTLLQTVERMAVLDQKWNPIHTDRLAVAGADGTIAIYRLDVSEQPQLELQTSTALRAEEQESRNTLALALDWSSDGSRLIVSNSHGCVELFNFNEGALQTVHSWKGHGFEAWTCSFSQHHEDVVYSELCEEYVAMALAEKLLVMSTKQMQRSKKTPFRTVYTLPKWEDFSFSEEQADFWCYECHTTDTVRKCEGCSRGFHDRCRKTIEEKQLELEQFVPKHKRITTASFGTGASLSRRQSTVAPEASNAAIVDSPSPLLMDNSVPGSGSHRRLGADGQMGGQETCLLPAAETATVKHETEDTIKEEDDTEFVCVVRPPNRRLEERLNTPSVKPEDSDDLEEVNRFCYACRLLKNSSNNAPPHVGKQELNYLLKFIIEQYKSWLPEDTYSLTKLRNGRVGQTPAWHRKTIEMCKKMFLRKTKSIAYIRKEVADERYNSLDEFHVDLLDVAHNVAIIHGVSSLEYDAMMYFLADCVFDLFEIRQCPDCYRHSNEKADPDFFTRPCRTRHELVYAKQKSYQYWPAKVMRVVNNKYVVRFFGNRHPRALVDANCVKPIDTELSSLKINRKYAGFQLALDELLKHQALLAGPRESFAFVSTPTPLPAVPNSGTTPTEEPLAPAPMIVAQRRKRGKLPQTTHAPPDTSQHIPSDQQSSQLRSIANSASVNSNTKGRALKRKEPTPRNTAAKQTRNNNTISASNQQSLESATVFESTKNNNTISNNLNGHLNETTPLTSHARLPRTKQNLKQMFAEQSSANKLKALLDQTNDVDEMKAAAIKALEENEERNQRKINWLKERHGKHISEIKKKQWCSTCEMESTLACCWNTSYCSTDCQMKHWPAHKRNHK